MKWCEQAILTLTRCVRIQTLRNDREARRETPTHTHQHRTTAMTIKRSPSNDQMLTKASAEPTARYLSDNANAYTIAECPFCTHAIINQFEKHKTLLTSERVVFNSGYLKISTEPLPVHKKNKFPASFHEISFTFQIFIVFFLKKKKI